MGRRNATPSETLKGDEATVTPGLTAPPTPEPENVSPNKEEGEPEKKQTKKEEKYKITGKFYVALSQEKDKFVVINPEGKRVSGPLDQDTAETTKGRFNKLAGLV